MFSSSDKASRLAQTSSRKERGDGYMFRNNGSRLNIGKVMPRQARESSGTGIYHVMMRGIRNYILYAYCLMSNE